ncbi:MAG: exodeoxyribonuclease VII large subunit [Gammaproteobacteria bacterium]|nr:exodeoxyribonuclease VII large subunit [Gammaproteobacteria bacterium]
MSSIDSNHDGLNTPRVLTVSQITHDVRFLLEESFPLVWVEGEVSNFRRPASGHWYFSLKDPRAQLRCAMFANRNRFVKTDVGDGLQVIVRCRLSLYEGRGEFQAIVDHIEPAGEGALRVAFDRLKTMLQAEGLFSPDRKLDVPRYPRHIGIVSSAHGAAVHDVLSVLERRFPSVRVTCFPIAVQGRDAEPQLIRALDQAEAWRDAPDVIIVTRGGGSLEDLWTFNLESVARRIAACKIPVISAIGHETDVTIADFVADARAPTPSVAAELATPDRRELSLTLSRLQASFSARFNGVVEEERRFLDSVRRRLIHPGRALEQKMQRCDDLYQRLERLVQNILVSGTARLEHIVQRLNRTDPRAFVAAHRDRVRQFDARLARALQQTQTHLASKLTGLERALNAVSPLNTLDRGYAIVAQPDDSKWGRPVTDAASLRPGEAIVAHLARGSVHSTVTHTELRDTEETRNDD